MQQDISQKSFLFSSSNPSQTGTRLITAHDPTTGFTVRTALNHDGKQMPAVMAFAGARFSRSALTAEELFTEINTGKKSAQEKLAAIFVNYGHASVGDMANLFLYVENIPRYLMMRFFYSTALGGGQERSSRYQNFSAAQAPDLALFLPENAKISTKNRATLQKQYKKLFDTLIGEYTQFLPRITEAFTDLYQPEPDNKGQLSALQARSFDTARAFLPAGTPTSGAYITSAREWARLIQVFKSAPDVAAQKLAMQIESLLAPTEAVQQANEYLPEAPDLIRHTEPDLRTAEAMKLLKSWLEKNSPEILQIKQDNKNEVQQSVTALSGWDSTAVFLYASVLRLAPHLTPKMYKKWEKSLTASQLQELSQILLSSYTHHNHLPQSAQTGGYPFLFQMTLSEAIDFNRHRAWGRFAPILETREIRSMLHDGWILPLYLNDPKLKKLRQEMSHSLTGYYEQLETFAAQIPDVCDPEILLSLLPNAHAIQYLMTGGPKELSYMTQLRVRPGGHINYRVLAHELSLEAAKLHPLLSALELPENGKPDPFSREQFFNRS